MKKILVFMALAVFLLMPVTSKAAYDLKSYLLDIVDARGRVVTDANFTVTVYDAGTSNAATIYKDDQKTAKTNPITPASDSAAAVGVVKFWGAATSYDIGATSSVYTASAIKVAGITPIEHILVFPLTEAVGNVSAGTLSASGAVTLNGAVTLGNAVTDITTLTGKIAGATPVTFDGATANTVYTIFAIADPTASSKTVTFPAETGAVMMSSLATNATGAANSVTGGTSQLIFEGSGVDDHEAIITATNPTSDTIWTIPVAAAGTYSLMSSTLATNAPDIANSVWGGTNQLIFEGSSADGNEAIFTVTNPTSDTIWTIPVAAAGTYSLMSSTLATNAPEIANSVWGGTNQLIFEGATANDFETIITPTEPTADNTLTLPDDSGDVAYTPTGGTTYGAGAGAIPVTHVYVAYTSVGGAEALTLANGKNGQILTVCHVTDGGNGVLTPATAAGWTSVDLADDGDTITLIYVDTVGWAVVGTAGVAAPPALTVP